MNTVIKLSDKFPDRFSDEEFVRNTPPRTKADLDEILDSLDLEIPAEFQTTDYDRFLEITKDLESQGYRDHGNISLREENYKDNEWKENTRYYFFLPKGVEPHEFSDLELEVLHEVLLGHDYTLTSAFTGKDENGDRKYIPYAVRIWVNRRNIEYSQGLIAEKQLKKARQKDIISGRTFTRYDSVINLSRILNADDVAEKIGKKILLKNAYAGHNLRENDISISYTFLEADVITRGDFKANPDAICKYLETYNASLRQDKNGNINPLTVFDIYFPTEFQLFLLLLPEMLSTVDLIVSRPKIKGKPTLVSDLDEKDIKQTNSQYEKPRLFVIGKNIENLSLSEVNEYNPYLFSQCRVHEGGSNYHDPFEFYISPHQANLLSRMQDVFSECKLSNSDLDLMATCPESLIRIEGNIANVKPVAQRAKYDLLAQ